MPHVPHLVKATADSLDNAAGNLAQLCPAYGSKVVSIYSMESYKNVWNIQDYFYGFIVVSHKTMATKQENVQKYIFKHEPLQHDQSTNDN